jgi:hypothetical protein
MHSLKDWLDEEHAHELVSHYAKQAGVRTADRARVLAAAEKHFQGLLNQWHRHGVDDQTIQATLASQPIVEWVVDRAVQDFDGRQT